MTTAFAGYANATLTFQVAVSSGEIDSLGNPVATTQDAIVEAYITEIPRERTQIGWSGGADNVLRVQGRCVEPAALPEGIIPGVAAKAVIGGVEGEFYLEPALQSAFEVLGQVAGEKIKGRFVTRSVMGEAL